MAEIIAVLMGLWVVILLIATPPRLRHQAFWAWLSVGFLAMCAVLWAMAGYLLVMSLCFVAMAMCSLWGLASGYSERKFWRGLDNGP